LADRNGLAIIVDDRDLGQGPALLQVDRCNLVRHRDGVADEDGRDEPDAVVAERDRRLRNTISPARSATIVEVVDMKPISMAPWAMRRP